MSAATRRRASARCSWCATSVGSARSTPTIAADRLGASAAIRSRSRSRGPRPATSRTPHGPVGPGWRRPARPAPRRRSRASDAVAGRSGSGSARPAPAGLAPARCARRGRAPGPGCRLGRHGRRGGRARGDRTCARHELVVDQLPGATSSVPRRRGGRSRSWCRARSTSPVDAASARSARRRPAGRGDGPPRSSSGRVQRRPSARRSPDRRRPGGRSRRWIGAGRARGCDLRPRRGTLEVAQAVAPVAARVDPVVAQPAGVAPGADRVRMHAEQRGRLRDGQRRVGRSGRKAVRRHDALGGTVKSTARAYRPHSSCQ